MRAYAFVIWRVPGEAQATDNVRPPSAYSALQIPTSLQSKRESLRVYALRVAGEAQATNSGRPSSASSAYKYRPLPRASVIADAWLCYVSQAKRKRPTMYARHQRTRKIQFDIYIPALGIYRTKRAGHVPLGCSRIKSEAMTIQ